MSKARSAALAALRRDHREIRRTIMLFSLSGTAGLGLGLFATPLATLLEIPELLVSTAAAEQWSIVCGAAMAFFVGASTD